MVIITCWDQLHIYLLRLTGRLKLSAEVLYLDPAAYNLIVVLICEFN